MAMATTAGNALAGAGVAAMQLAPAQPAFTLDPDFPVFDGGAGGVAGVGPLPPLPPLYQVDAAVVSGKADNACFAVEVAVDRMHAAVWDKRTSKAVAVNLDPREPAMEEGWEDGAGERHALVMAAGLAKGASIRKWLRKPARKRMASSAPAVAATAAAKAVASQDPDTPVMWPLPLLGARNKASVPPQVDTTGLLLKDLADVEPEFERDGGSGVYAELTCTAMSDDDGVRYEKTDTKVMVRPEDALALLLCYAAQGLASDGPRGYARWRPQAQRASKPGPPKRAAASSDLPERDTRVVPAVITLVVPAALSMRARMTAVMAVEQAGLCCRAVLPFAAAAAAGALSAAGRAPPKALTNAVGGSVLVLRAAPGHVEVSRVAVAGAFDASELWGGVTAFSVLACAAQPCARDATEQQLVEALVPLVHDVMAGGGENKVAALLAYLPPGMPADVLAPARAAAGGMEVVLGEPTDAVLGGSALAKCAAGGGKASKAGKAATVTVTDALPYAVGMTLTARDIHEGERAKAAVVPLFARWAGMDATSHSRVLTAAEHGDVLVTVVQRRPGSEVSWEPVCAGRSPLHEEAEEEEGELTLEHATLNVAVNADGLLDYFVTDQGPPTAESLNKVEAKKQRAKMTKIVYSILLLVIMVLGPLAYILTDVYQTSTATAARRAEHVLRLENYYAEVAAEKLEQGGQRMLHATLDKYKGKEWKLWLALEKKYGVFPKVPHKGAGKKGKKGEL